MPKNYVLKLFITYIITTYSITYASTENTRWPIPDWEVSENLNQIDTDQCQNFENFAFKTKGVKTDGLLIIKNGIIDYEKYSNDYDVNRPHVLWSVTKTITGILLGTAERDGRINLDDKLFNFYPNSNADNNYNKITIKNLLYLDTGFIWDEKNQSINDNSVVEMLFGKGHKDMALFATRNKLIKEGPFYEWTYSTGTPTITMGVLHKVYGDKINDEFPWMNLFNPLGLHTAFFERDLTGSYIGGAGAFATPRDLAKIGHLFLNQGIWDGEVIITPGWIKKMLTPSPGYISPGTVIDDVRDTGVYGGSLWINRAVKKGQGKPYPYSPDDMYLAVGLQGQLLIMLPSQKMLIVRTGHDLKFNSYIDEFVSRSLSCFYDPNYPVAKKIQKKFKPITSLGKIIKGVKNAIFANTLQGSIAKIICSCHFVSQIDIPTCLKHNDLTISKLLTKLEVKKDVLPDNKISIRVRLPRFFKLFKLDYNNSSIATFDPNHAEYGCTLK